MNFLEEQRIELEALSEIYYNETTVISDKFPISFSIKARSQATNIGNESDRNQSYDTDSVGSDDDDIEDDDDDDDDNDDDDDKDNDQEESGEEFVEIKFTLPAKYPSEMPEMDFVNSSGVSKSELEQLRCLLILRAQESVGCVMIFTLVNEVVEWLIKRSDKERQENREIEEQDEQERLKNERKRFEGTRVTKETFLAWKNKFDSELLHSKLLNQQVETEQKRLTGREMFELDKTLNESDLNFGDDIDPTSLDGLLEDIDELVIDE